MNISGQTVVHKVFGEGTIAQVENAAITVDFNGEVKRFIYPEAFNGYLTAVDPGFGEYIATICDSRTATTAAPAVTVTHKPKNNRPVILEDRTRAQRYEDFISSAYSMWSEEWTDDEEKWF